MPVARCAGLGSKTSSRVLLDSARKPRRAFCRARLRSAADAGEARTGPRIHKSASWLLVTPPRPSEAGECSQVELVNRTRRVLHMTRLLYNMFLQFSSPPYGSCENVPESFAAPPCPPIRDSIAVITIITDPTAVTVSGHSKRCRESSGEPSGDSAGRVPESPQVRLHPPRPLPPSSLPPSPFPIASLPLPPPLPPCRIRPLR